MAQRTLTHLYSTYAEAVQVLADLTAIGVPSANVSLIESESDARLPGDVARDEARNPLLGGLTVGAAIGGGIGALVGVQAITIPYTESLVATGWMLPLAMGAVIGGVLGAIVGTVMRLGVSNTQAHALAEGLQRGQQLVMVRVEEAYAPQVQAVLDRPHTISASQSAEEMFDEEPPVVPGTSRAAVADIHREERRIQYE